MFLNKLGHFLPLCREPSNCQMAQNTAINGAATKRSATTSPTRAPHSRRPPPCDLVATCACWRCGACCAPRPQ